MHSGQSRDDGIEVVAHEQDRATGSRSTVGHLAEALALELGVADGEHLVDEQDVGVEVGGHRERRGGGTCRRSSA